MCSPPWRWPACITGHDWGWAAGRGPGWEAASALGAITYGVAPAWTTLYACGGDGLWSSADDGQTWQPECQRRGRAWPSRSIQAPIGTVMYISKWDQGILPLGRRRPDVGEPQPGHRPAAGARHRDRPGHAHHPVCDDGPVRRVQGERMKGSGGCRPMTSAAWLTTQTTMSPPAGHAIRLVLRRSTDRCGRGVYWRALLPQRSTERRAGSQCRASRGAACSSAVRSGGAWKAVCRGARTCSWSRVMAAATGKG